MFPLGLSPERIGSSCIVVDRRTIGRQRSGPFGTQQAERSNPLSRVEFRDGRHDVYLG
jgi:hypothetical protein